MAKLLKQFVNWYDEVAVARNAKKKTGQENNQ